MDLLEIRNISKHFGGIIALDNFSMKVKKNQLIGIIQELVKRLQEKFSSKGRK
jgi:ABC-type branched-subunit amino acid transport system ATPase component